MHDTYKKGNLNMSYIFNRHRQAQHLRTSKLEEARQKRNIQSFFLKIIWVGLSQTHNYNYERFLQA